MKSKILQKKGYGRNQSHEVVDGEQEDIEDSSVPRKGLENPDGRVNPAVAAQARKDFPRLLSTAAEQSGAKIARSTIPKMPRLPPRGRWTLSRYRIHELAHWSTVQVVRVLARQLRFAPLGTVVS